MSSESLKKYSEAVIRLEEILDNIDRSNVNIDDLADLVKEAAYLIKICRSVLKNTEESVEESLNALEDT